MSKKTPEPDREQEYRDEAERLARVLERAEVH